MEVKSATLELQNSLPKEPLVGVPNVISSMMDVKAKLSPADYKHYEPFAHVYLGVTEDVDRGIQIGNENPLFKPFKEPGILHTATGRFWYHGARQLDTQGPEKHWQPLLEDERARHVDVGTQLWLGMIAHIGGDLARTVYEAEANREYIKHDYPLINRLLEQRAHRVSELFVPVHNEKLRKHITDTAMIGIRTGRSYALHDYRKLNRAKSEDQRMHIIEASHERTAKIANAFLSLSHRINNSNIVTSHFTAAKMLEKAA